MGQLRESKKQETRQRISDIATEQFFLRGYDAVTVDEIAIAAGVSKMTVFNYFSRKEELILDREDDLNLLPLRQALRNRPKGQAPVDTLLTLVRTMNHEEHPLCHINPLMATWWRVVDASPALTARLREIDDEASALLAIEWGGANPAAIVRIWAGMIVLTLRLARAEAVALIERGAAAKKANAVFLELVAQGFSAVQLGQQQAAS